MFTNELYNKKNIFKNLCLISGTKFFEGGEVIATPVFSLLIIVSGLRFRRFCHCIIVVVVLYFLIWNYRMCWAGLFQVGWVQIPSVAVQVFGSSLERGVVRSSERQCLIWTCSCAFLARARFSSLERVSSSFARAIVPSRERVACCRPEGVSSSLDRAFFRSSELLSCWLEQGFLGASVVSLCLVARATKSSLERACPVYIRSSGF